MQMQQEIPRSQYLQPNFIHGGVRYNLQAANWKESKFKSSFQQQQFFTNSDDCSYAIAKKSLFCLAPNSKNPMLSSLYSYNLVTQEIKEWRADEDTNTPLLRKKYGLVNYDGRICLFGGVNHIQYFNDLTSFCSYSNMWIPVLKDSSVVPEPRMPYVFTQVDNNNLLLFGGSNQRGFLKDAFLLKDFKWKELRIPGRQQIGFNSGFIDEIIKSQGIRYCSLKNAIYFFGGGEGNKLSNDLYQMKVDDRSLALVVKKVQSDTGPRPCGRVYHSMQKIGQTSFAVYGGFNGNVHLRDISVFDYINQKWTQVHPLNGPMSTLSQPKMFYESHSIYILGNSSQKYGNRKCMLALSFPQFELIKSEICTNCIKRLDFKEKQQLSGPKKPFISNGLIYNMAMQLSFPYQAIALLMDCASILKASSLSIKSSETNNKLSYLDIRFDGIPPTRQQYSSIISHSYLQDPIVLEVIDRLKLGAMRLGKTLIYASTCGEFRRVFLFSADSLIISHYHQLYAYFSYEERIADEWLLTQESANHKKFILNTLKSYFVNPSQLINSIPNSSFLIFESNVIMTTQKIYYGEIITTNSDISLCKSRKKVEFLDNLGFSLSQDPEVALSKYLEYTYLNPTIKSVVVQNKTITLQGSKYFRELEKLQTNFVIRPLCKQKVAVKEVEAQCYLYEVVDTNRYVKELKGILVYYQGRLINRLDTNFGDLFWCKFYKNKYRKPFGLWTHVGVINFLKGVQPKSMRNEFKNENYYNYYIRFIKKEYLNKHPQKISLIIDVEEEGKTSKLIKRQR